MTKAAPGNPRGEPASRRPPRPPRPQRPRRETFARARLKKDPRRFDYDLDYRALNLREHPELYRVGVGEQGVLTVEPYKSEILPAWRFRNREEAAASIRKLQAIFRRYRRAKDFVGMDMTRKFLQMGFTRARRYANHRSGKKYDERGEVLPRTEDAEKAAAAALFFTAWKEAEADPVYRDAKVRWKKERG